MYHEKFRQRTDDMNLTGYSRKSVPASGATDADEIYDPAAAGASDYQYYTFEADSYVTIAASQGDANTNIAADTDRKKMRANEFGYWNKDEIPSGSKVWAKAVADSSTFVNFEHRQEKTVSAGG